jgi:hypothetical protein
MTIKEVVEVFSYIHLLGVTAFLSLKDSPTKGIINPKKELV